MTTLLSVDWEESCQQRLRQNGVEQIRGFYYCIACGHPIDVVLIYDGSPPERRARGPCLCNSTLPCPAHPEGPGITPSEVVNG
jgi:hypothetical protein